MTELEKCPFCGGKARIITVGMFYHCECDDCFATSDHATNMEYAITLWNTRPNLWHTGTPTEEGWYLLAYDENFYCSNYWKGGCWVNTWGGKLLAWQKIEPFEVNKETDNE